MRVILGERMFESKKTDALLSLLAMTALADKKLFASEIDCFVRTAMRLEHEQAFEEKLSAPKLLMWFELNRDRLKSQMRTPGFQSWFTDCATNLKSVKGKPKILEAMSQISQADNELHVGEVALIKLTASIWNLSMPTLAYGPIAHA